MNVRVRVGECVKRYEPQFSFNKRLLGQQHDGLFSVRNEEKGKGSSCGQRKKEAFLIRCETEDTSKHKNEFSKVAKIVWSINYSGPALSEMWLCPALHPWLLLSQD